ncbi:SEC59/DGK1/VTE5 family protein [Patescibacteria group bacterium]|nr:SEC59/DGK1/VTE5 family protein [Patescibacteria group bacterium]MBU1682598.1 SEC59/DGK1/VTE5 family protein [Patescibacteria group bacterium]MBU1935663.1 SEC59/DGK1/VTE5 family protein [Patescibacteria group bacterium]
MHKLELRRQFIHLIYGPILVLLHYYQIINESLVLGMIIGGAIASYLIKHEKLSLIARVLALFERDHHMKQFPGRGILFFTIGAYLCLILFPQHIAYAGILILSVGDAFTNIIGRHFGKIKTKLNPNKFIEGTLVGILVSIPVAYYFVPNIYAAISAACIAMFLEMPHLKLFGYEIDDNLLIPLGASFTLSLFV